jgi:hypothetical protein
MTLSTDKTSLYVDGAGKKQEYGTLAELYVKTETFGETPAPVPLTHYIYIYHTDWPGIERGHPR